eukprot:jgi/Ulvmu1/1845/UM012_0001.1
MARIISGRHVVETHSCPADEIRNAAVQFVNHDWSWQAREPDGRLTIHNTTFRNDGPKSRTFNIMGPDRLGDEQGDPPRTTVTLADVHFSNVVIVVSGGVNLSLVNCSFTRCDVALHIVHGATAELTQVAFAACGTAMHVAGKSDCRLDKCTVTDAAAACIKAFQESTVSATNCSLTSSGRFALRACTGGCLNISMSAVTAIDSEAGTAVEVFGGASATISSSRLTGGGFGARCIGAHREDSCGRLRVWDSLVVGGRAAVQASHAVVEAWDGCRLRADGGAAVVVKRGSRLAVADSDLSCNGRAAVAGLDSCVDVQRCGLACAGGPGTAAVALHRVRRGSMLLGNSVVGDFAPEHDIVFALPLPVDRRAVQAAPSELLKHRRVDDCNVLRARCAVLEAQQAAPEGTALVEWLQELGAKEVSVAERVLDHTAAACDTFQRAMHALLQLLKSCRVRVRDVGQAVWRSSANVADAICAVVSSHPSEGMHVACMLVWLLAAAAACALMPLEAVQVENYMLDAYSCTGHAAHDGYDRLA